MWSVIDWRFQKQEAQGLVLSKGGLLIKWVSNLGNPEQPITKQKYLWSATPDCLSLGDDVCHQVTPLNIRRTRPLQLGGVGVLGLSLRRCRRQR